MLVFGNPVVGLASGYRPVAVNTEEIRPAVLVLGDPGSEKDPKPVDAAKLAPDARARLAGKMKTATCFGIKSGVTTALVKAEKLCGTGVEVTRQIATRARRRNPSPVARLPRAGRYPGPCGGGTLGGMELRQLRYFVRVVELGSMSRAAVDLGVVQSALSQQIARLEGELSTRLLQRTAKGVAPTEAGLAFFQQAQLALRHADEAARAAQQSRLSGVVSVGLAPTTASVLGLPLMRAVRERYPDVRLHMVESLSGHLAAMLNARQLDLAVLFDTDPGRRWSVTPLADEKLFVMQARGRSRTALPAKVRLADLKDMPLILPSAAHGLRTTLDEAMSGERLRRLLPIEIDSLTMLMDAVQAGLGATVQPRAALARVPQWQETFEIAEIAERKLVRLNSLCSLSDDELSPAGLAVRVVLADCARELVRSGRWEGAALSHHKS